MVQNLEEEMQEFEEQIGEDPLALNPFHFLPIVGTPAYANSVRKYLLSRGIQRIKFTPSQIYKMVRKGSRPIKKIAYNFIIIRLFQAGVGAKVLETFYEQITKAF